jgi:hypothetical protein
MYDKPATIRDYYFFMAGAIQALENVLGVDLGEIRGGIDELVTDAYNKNSLEKIEEFLKERWGHLCTPKR